MNAIEELAQRLGDTVPRMWANWERYEALSALSAVILALMVAGATVVLAVWAWRRLDDDPDSLGRGLVVAAAALALAVCLIVLVANCIILTEPAGYLVSKVAK